MAAAGDDQVVEVGGAAVAPGDDVCGFAPGDGGGAVVFGAGAVLLDAQGEALLLRSEAGFATEVEDLAV